MRFFYVKDGGTADGSTVDSLGTNGISDTKLVGAWSGTASEYFPSISSVFNSSTLALEDGDIVLCANTHMASSNSVLQLKSNSISGNVIIVSVDVSDREIYKKGAYEYTTSALQLGIVGVLSFIGVHFKCDNIQGTTTGCKTVFTDCQLTFDHNSTDAVSYLADGVEIQLRKCELVFLGSAQSLCRLGASTRLIVDGCYGNNVNKGKYLINGTTHGGKGSLVVTNTDLNSMLDWISLIGSVLVSVPYSDGVIIDVNDSIIPDRVVNLINNDIFGVSSFEINLNRCSDFNNSNDKNALYYSEYHNWQGVCLTTPNVYLNYSYDGGTSFASVLMNSTKSSIGNPLRHKLCEIPAQDLATTDRTYRVNLLLDTDSISTLTDSQFTVEVGHGDNSALALGVINDSGVTDLLSAGTELTSSTATWLGTLPANTKAYQVDITLSSASLTNVTDTMVTVYTNLKVADVDLYVCPAVQIGV